MVSPTSDTTYTLTATGPGGTTSQSVTVAVGGGNGFTLSASPAQVNSGDTITVTWTAPQGQTTSTDWIGMYLQGAANSSYRGFKYTGGGTSGNADFTAPSPNGIYEFRYLTNDSYNDVATSNAVTVGQPQPVITLSASPQSIAAGDNSTLTWIVTDATTVTASDGWSGDKALSGSEMVSPAQTTTYTLTATGPGGTVSQSVTVTVGGGGSFTLSASPAQVNSGDTITVTWTAPQGQTNSNDWIGMFAQGAANSAYLAYSYTGGGTSGSASFTALSTQEVYEFRYLPRDGFLDVVTSNTVTVQ